MIVVDTSVWIAARRDAALGRTLDSLLDADEVALALPVRLELWAGIARKDRTAFDAAFSALVQVVPDEDTWRRMAEGVARAADAGERFAFVDMLIATLATGTGRPGVVAGRRFRADGATRAGLAIRSVIAVTPRARDLVSSVPTRRRRGSEPVLAARLTGA